MIHCCQCCCGRCLIVDSMIIIILHWMDVFEDRCCKLNIDTISTLTMSSLFHVFIKHLSDMQNYSIEKTRLLWDTSGEISASATLGKVIDD